MELQAHVGDFVSFDEHPDDFPFGAEGKVVSISSGCVLVSIPGCGELLVFCDLYGPWDSLGNFKVDFPL